MSEDDQDPDTGSGSPAPGFTIKNIEEVEDAVKARGGGDFAEVRFASGDLGLVQGGFSHHRINSGQRQPFGHEHNQAEELYVVIAGSGRVKLDDEIHEIARLDAIRVGPEVKRAFEAGPDGIEFLAFGQHFEKDGRILPDWWID
ncbi:MAG: hypothetical protein JJE10_07475 [Thermoleophilia bacterium]|nr:hypothetical protein [Thermoleophilia bacterium]